MQANLKAIPRGYAMNKSGLLVPDSCITLMASIKCHGPDGKLKGSIVQPARSFVRWFGRFLEALGDGTNGDVKFLVDDVTNQQRRHVWRGAAAGGPVEVGTSPPQIGFGIGLQAPQADDHALQTPLTSIASHYDANVVLQEDSNGSTLTISAQGINTGAKFSLSEIVLETTWDDDLGGGLNAWIAARDTFSAVEIDTNDTFSGSYSIILAI